MTPQMAAKKKPPLLALRLLHYPVFQLFVRQFKYCILALLTLQNVPVHVPVHVPVSLILEVLKPTEN